MNGTAQALITNYAYALAGLLLFFFQHATNDILAAGISVVWRPREAPSRAALLSDNLAAPR